MIKIREAIVVEGRYDKAVLSAFLDTVIIDTQGFGIFRDDEKLALLRRLAKTRGLVIFTDSDGGGFVIRNYLKGAIDPKYVKHAYIPDIPGKEHRKRCPGREGLLGVEGMSREVLIESLCRAGVRMDEDDASVHHAGLTKADLYALGFVGRPDSDQRRQKLKAALCLPAHLTNNALLDVLNCLVTRDELFELTETL